MPKLLEGKTAAVTGGAQGIGRDVSIGLSKEGCRVIIGDINYDGAKETAKIITDAGGEAFPVDVDISNELQVQQMIDRGIEKFQKIDILINNAAYVKKTKFLEYDVSEWRKVIDVSLNGYFLCMQAAAKEMAKTGGGHIINISSMVGMIAHGGLTAYAVAKAGVITMTKLTGIELKKHNISVNAIAPGLIDTPLTKEVMGKMGEGGGGGGFRPPMAAIGKPEDITKTVLWLLTADTATVTGNVIDMGGTMVG